MMSEKAKSHTRITTQAIHDFGISPFEAFRDAESYYATLAHELTHPTKHEYQLNRDFGRRSWGDEAARNALRNLDLLS